MNIVSYSGTPWNLFDDFTHSLDRMWEVSMGKDKDTFSPACDAHEKKNHYLFSFDLPGVDKKDINIEVRDNILHVYGEKRDEYKTKDDSGKRLSEKFYGQFQRSFTLPVDVKKDGIEACFKNGVLELLVPKKTSDKKLKISVTDKALAHKAH